MSTKIAHLADIHIRLYQRHKEYKEVFDNLFDSLKEQDYIEQLVICGDIFHNRNNLSPEGIELFNYLMDGLNSIVGRVILFAGNHDAVLTSKNERLDALSPLVNMYNRDNDKYIWYLKDSDVYKYHNVDYILYSVLDDNQPDLTKVREDSIKIGLYHGMVNGSKLDSGRDVTQADFDVEWDFFDIFMLGDIHKYQEIRENTVYSSSLVQQNYGEHPIDHGYCLWDLDSLEHEFIKVPNSYGYYKVYYEDGKFNIPYNIPENANIQLFYPPVVDFVKIKKIATDQFSTQNINYNKLTDDEVKGNINITDNITDLFDINTIEELFIQYLGKDNDLLSDLLKLNKKIFEQNHQKISDNFIGGSYQLVSLEFDNMFAYGEGNRFDFIKNNGIAGFFSHNRSGKTSFLNTLVFALYGNADVIDKQIEMVNNKSDYYRTKLTLIRDNDTYIIERSGTVGKNGLNNKVSLLKNGSSIGGTITEINKDIRDLFGDYDVFYKLFYIVQRSPRMFLSLTPMERKQWLYDNLGVNIFEILHRSAKDEYNALNYKMKELLKIEFEDEFDRLDFEIADRKGKIKKAERSIKSHKEKIEKIDNKIESINISDYSENDLLDKTNKISELENQKNDLRASVDKLSNLSVDDYVNNNEEVKKLVEKIEVKKKEINNFDDSIDGDKKREYENKIEKIKERGKVKFNKYSKLKKALATVEEPNDEEISVLENELENTKSSIDKNEFKISSLKDDMEDSKKKSQILKKDSRFENEDLCKTCPLLKSAFESKNEIPNIEENIIHLNNEIKKLSTKRKSLVQELEELFETKLMFDDFRKIEHEVENMKDNLSNTESALESFIENEKSRLKNKKESLLNDRISLKNKLNSKKTELKSEIEEKINSVGILKEKIKSIDDKIEILKSEKETISEKIEEDKKKREVLDTLKKDKKDLQNELDDSQNSLQKIGNELSLLEKEYKDLDEKKNEYDEVKEDLKLYEEYTNATHKDALPLLFVENILSIFQNQINKVISQIDDFKIILEIENNNINSYMEDSRGVWSTNLASGMESFVINLAFRVAISKIGNICRPNFMIVDEGFGALDSDNQQSIPDVFRYLKTDFEHIFVVSHDDFMRDYVDYNVDIYRKDDFSYIQQ